MDNIALRKMRDEEIVELIRSGQENAFEEILARYEASVYRLTSLFTGSSSIAEEVLARVFCELYVRIHDISQVIDVQEFIFAYAVEQTDLFKSHVGAVERLDEGTEDTYFQIEFDFPNDDIFDGLPLHRWSSMKLRNRLKASFEISPEDYKRAIVLHDVLGVSTARIGKIFSKAIPEVKVLVFRARVAMRSFLRSPGALPYLPQNNKPNLRGSHHCDA